MDKIKIHIGSHISAHEINREAKKKLNDLLLSKANPVYNDFNKENVYLDDTNGFISIVHSSTLLPHISRPKADKLNKFIRKHVTNHNGENDFFVYIGEFIYNK